MREISSNCLHVGRWLIMTPKCESPIAGDLVEGLSIFFLTIHAKFLVFSRLDSNRNWVNHDSRYTRSTPS
jgi:hypothetical protein